MRPTSAVWQHALRVTLFTRANCSLCTDAKAVLSAVWDRRHFEYDEIDVMAAGQRKWKDLYEFDTPVAHFDKAQGRGQTVETTAKARKLMHRFTEAQVDAAMDDVEKK